MAKRRKGGGGGGGGGKQGSRAATPSSAISDSDGNNSHFLDSNAGAKSSFPSSGSSPFKSSSSSTKTTGTQPPTASSQVSLVLTSDKRRGIYECDYCHSDISQVPRIRCATCPDFDLCLDCFATTDHSAAIARLRAAATAHGAVYDQGSSSNNNNNNYNNSGGHGGKGGGTFTFGGGGITATPGISASAIHHDDTHKYRVADSTRYPMFPSARVISKELLSTQNNDESGAGTNAIGEDDDDDDDDDDDSDEVMTNATTNTTGKKTGDTKQETTTSSALPLPPSSVSGTTATTSEMTFVKQDDPKTFWTVEEDLRLLDAISTCGLGNWADIAEAVAGQGSSSKTAKRCMERYFDDFLGRYGHILPAYTIVDENDDDNDTTPAPLPGASTSSSPVRDANDNDNIVSGTNTSAGTNPGDAPSDNEPKKRRMERMSSFGVASLTGGNRRGKKLKVIPTSSIPGYDKLWPNPYIPPLPEVPQIGQDVGRDQRYRAEQLYVKLIASAPSKDEVDRIRKEWEQTRLNKPNGPTALPMRPEDLPTLPGSELAGFMSRRGDFDLEWDNDAENVLADMEFSASDSSQDRDLKVKVIQIYNSKLDERDRRKEFLLRRNLVDYRQLQEAESKLPRDERDLVRRMRLLERLHTPEEHAQFIEDILKAKRLRKEIAQLQMYRRIGIRTLAEAEKYENDKKRREIHKMSHLQKEAEKAEKAEAMAKMISGGGSTGTAFSKDGGSSTPGASSSAAAIQGADEDDITSSLWKQYRTNDRKHRRSINRNSTNNNNKNTTTNTTTEKADGSSTTEKGTPEATATTTTTTPTNTSGVNSTQKPTDKALPGSSTATDGTTTTTTRTNPTPIANTGESKTKEKGDVTVDSMQSKEQTTKTTTTTTTTTIGEEAKSSKDEPTSQNKDENQQQPPSSSSSLATATEQTSIPKEDPNKNKTLESTGDKSKNTNNNDSNNDGIMTIDFALTGMPGYDLLTKKEIELCRELKMKPSLYLKVKRAILQESFRAGLCDKESGTNNTSNNNHRTIVTIDIQKRGNVVDFMVKAGWISTKVGNVIKG